MNVKHFAKASIALIIEGKNEDLVLANLRKELEKRGETKLYPQVLKEMVRTLEVEARKKRATITIARESDKKRLSKSIDRAITELGSPESNYIIDRTIIGGFIIRTRDSVLDRSYKHQLLSIYHEVTE